MQNRQLLEQPVEARTSQRFQRVVDEESLISTLRERPQPRTPRLKIYRYLMRGLEQQFWFLGQDIRHGANLLARFGFRSFRSGASGSSRYHLPWREGCIELHSWCGGYYLPSARGFIFIRGRANSYLYDGAEPSGPECLCHAPLIIPELSNWSQFEARAADFLAWVEEYEAWVERIAGSAYRQGLFPHAPLPWLAPGEARAWFKRFRVDPSSVRVPCKKRRPYRSFVTAEPLLRFG